MRERALPVTIEVSRMAEERESQEINSHGARHDRNLLTKQDPSSL